MSVNDEKRLYKRREEFYFLFKSIPSSESFIDSFSCALNKEILLHGRLYMSAHHLCFHSNILGWSTNIVLPFVDVVSIEKRMTAFVIPNAIQISTLHAKYFFASFLWRDETYAKIISLWKDNIMRKTDTPNTLTTSIRNANFLFTESINLHTEHETKFKNVVCDSLYIDTPFNVVKMLLENEFRPMIHMKCLTNLPSIMDVHSQQRILMNTDMSIELEYLFECETYSGSSSVVVRTHAIPHTNLHSCISIQFECISNDNSCISVKEWHSLLADSVTFFSSQQDPNQPTICVEKTWTFNPKLFLNSLLRLSLVLMLFIPIILFIVRGCVGSSNHSTPTKEITEMLARISQNAHRAEIAIEEFIDSFG